MSTCSPGRSPVATFCRQLLRNDVSPKALQDRVLVASSTVLTVMAVQQPLSAPKDKCMQAMTSHVHLCSNFPTSLSSSPTRLEH